MPNQKKTWVKTINSYRNYKHSNEINKYVCIKEHEEKQNRFRALRNRQDLFQEEGILNLILEAIDKVNIITSQGFMVSLAGDESGQSWEIISGYLYQLLGEWFRIIIDKKRHRCT